MITRIEIDGFKTFQEFSVDTYSLHRVLEYLNGTSVQTARKSVHEAAAR